jgi:hypothetical protein
MEKPTLMEFFRAMYTAHPFISYETVKILYEEKYKVAEADPEIEIKLTKKTKKKK